MKEAVVKANQVVTEACYKGLKDSVEEAYFEAGAEPQRRPKIRRAAERANSWLDMIAGKDNNLYYDNELRLFYSQGNRYTLVQGEEMDVDARERRRRGD